MTHTHRDRVKCVRLREHEVTGSSHVKEISECESTAATSCLLTVQALRQECLAWFSCNSAIFHYPAVPPGRHMFITQLKGRVIYSSSYALPCETFLFWIIKAWEATGHSHPLTLSVSHSLTLSPPNHPHRSQIDFNNCTIYWIKGNVKRKSQRVLV